MGNLKSAVLTWGFMSLGLRATVLLIPMIFALFFKNRVKSSYAILSSILGFASFLIFGLLFDISIDSLIIGIVVSALPSIIGFLVNLKHEHPNF